ncbi:MAG: HNH endonuclease, partial [Acidobacteriota bacterium]|nr:HNH endonuclease [Acidobacteriota bacterium]
VYTHVDADPGGVAARRRRTADENKQALDAFRRDELDVLINVRMLTEGTDVPDIRTVFLTRQTTSGILLTQMIGRALRGPKFGGTAEAHIVSFFDNWQHLINWADYQPLSEGLADESAPEYAKRPPLQYVSIDLVQRLSRQMDTGQNITTGPFLSFLPVGWYRVEFETRVAGSDDLEDIRTMVMVFENERETYQQFMGFLREMDLATFEAPEANFNQQIEELTAWRQKFFADFGERSESDLLTNLFHIARHMAQNQTVPDFFLFEEREQHDLDRVARQIIEADLGPLRKNQALETEYSRTDCYWNVIYPNYLLFKSQYDACENHCVLGDVIPQQVPSPSHPELRVEREPSDDLKEQVKARDGYRCLCCGEISRRSLQIDHVSPAYLGVINSLENLQTLCRVCNGHKGGINEINFRNNRTLLAAPPKSFTEFDLPPKRYASEPEEWEKFLQRSINFFYRCAAVEYVRIGRRGASFYHWQVYLYAHNDPRWLESHLPMLLQRIRGRRAEAKKPGPDKITIAATDLPSVVYPL